MKAAFYEQRGPAREVLRLETVPDPEPGPGEVRVRVRVSAVNPSDTKARGTWRSATAMPYPRVIPHQDGAGVIDKVGDGVDAARVGERVWIYMAQRGRPFGTAAEYCVVPAVRAVPLPAGADFAEGACLGIPAMTAHYALFSDGPVAGQTVLVHGGAGAVGFYAVQLAKWGGAARVAATVSRPEQARQALEAGADVVINYKSEDVVNRVRQACGAEAPVDRIIDVAFGANQDADAALIAPRGVIATYASDSVQTPVLRFYDFMLKNVTLRMLIIYEAPQGARDMAARDIGRAISAKQLKHQVAVRFPLDRIAEAHEAMESGAAVGKILVDIPG